MFQSKGKLLLQGIVLVFGIILTFGVVFAEEVEEIQTVYHVYVDGNHFGEVSDTTIADQVIQSKLESGQQVYQDIAVTIGEKVSYVTELAFNPSFDDDKVSEELEQLLTIKAEGVALIVGDETVGYFKNIQDANEVLKQYKLKYVDEETLDHLESIKLANEENTSVLTQPKIGESIIVDVTLSEEVSLSEEKVNPESILSVEEGLKLLSKGTLTEQKHTIQEGEVLGQIANKYDLTLDELLDLNPSLTEDSLIQIGDELHVTALQPFVDVIVVKEGKKEEVIHHKTEVVESNELYKGDEAIRQNGSDGEKVVHYQTELRNGQVAKREVIDEEVTKEVQNKIIVKGTKVIPSRGTGELRWPAVGGYVSSYQGQRWGRYHKGIDIARPSNRNIIAADNGTVVEARYHGSFGNKIVINHNNGMKTLYAHLSAIHVKVGQTVEKGTVIGTMGSTGNSTGVHLHFEVYKNGVLQNPLDYY